MTHDEIFPPHLPRRRRCLRRADGRDLDYILHANPSGKEKGLLMMYNPLDREVKKTLTIPLYYTGLSEKATIHERDGAATTSTLSRDYSVQLPVTLPAKGTTWFTFE
jgi:hypothetical protein